MSSRRDRFHNLARCNSTLFTVDGAAALELCKESAAAFGLLGQEGLTCSHCKALLFKITGHVEPVAHLLVLETIGAEAVEATAYERKYYTIDKPATNAAVRAKVLIVKNLAEFWGFGFQTDLL